MKTNWYLIINGQDTYSERTLDRIEEAAHGVIRWTSDDSCGNTKLQIQPRFRPTKIQRKEILEAVMKITGRPAKWIEDRVGAILVP